MIVIPKRAATVILLREKRPDGFEVFLLKRHEKSSFMGGNYVYPGGRVDREDGSTEICSFCKGLSYAEAHQIFGGNIGPEESFAHWVAGIRELYEEAGVLFAYDQNGDLLELNNQETKEKYSQYRNRLQKGEISISQIARQEKLLLALDQLRHYAHWITPEARSERFDTHFFIACHPREQEAFHDQKETIEGIWLTPEKALEENLQRKVALSPPTLKTLEDLSRYRNMDDLFKSLNKKEIYPILPILTKTPSGPVLFFPWDPDYEPLKKGQTPLPADLGTLSQSGDNTTRLILQEGFWIPYYKKAIDSMR
jgi:8-oxo-dGTP pyrophosphatase MutT (NUDIX family)